jgi:Divergent InlB B-repeat domain
MKQGAIRIYLGLFAVVAAIAFLVISISGAKAASYSTVSLSLRVTGVGSAVTTRPSGVLQGCAGSRCTYGFAPNTAVTLTATASNQGSHFARWLGACTGSQSSCSLLMTESKAVTARFSPVRLYIQPTPGEGSVEVTTPGTYCGFGCTQFEYGTTVKIIARECCGYRFDSWSGTCSDVQGNTCSFRIFDLAETTPRFRCDGSDCVGTSQSPLSRDVKAKLYVYGHGTVAINGKNCTGPTVCQFVFTRNQAVVLRAYGSTFDRWGGTVCSGSSPRCQFSAFTTPSGIPQRVTATFRS